MSSRNVHVKFKQCRYIDGLNIIFSKSVFLVEVSTTYLFGQSKYLIMLVSYRHKQKLKPQYYAV